MRLTGSRGVTRPLNEERNVNRPRGQMRTDAHNSSLYEAGRQRPHGVMLGSAVVASVASQLLEPTGLW
jgi:hypothetical protein